MRIVNVTLLLFCLLAGVAAGAKKATLVGTLVDDGGEPIADVNVTLSSADFKKTVTTDKKGRFKIVAPDATWEYEILFEREGMSPYDETLTFDPRGGTQGKAWSMTLTPPEATSSMDALGAYNAAVQAFNDGDPDLAIAKFNEALAADPGFVDAQMKIAWIHTVQADHEQAAAAATRVLELVPNEAGALQMLYDAERALGRDSAGATLDRLAEAAPGPDTAVLVYNEGVAARRNGDLERAHARYELATRLDPANTQAHVALAGVLQESGDYDAALASSGRALELDPENARGVAVHYNTLIAAGRDDDAQAMLDDLQRLAPGAVAQAYLERGALLFDEGQVESAILALQRAISADPQSARAHYTLGLCYMSGGDTPKATEHLGRFLELTPDDPDAAAARGLLESLRPG